jgi:hypothetical protein
MGDNDDKIHEIILEEVREIRKELVQQGKDNATITANQASITKQLKYIWTLVIASLGGHGV